MKTAAKPQDLTATADAVRATIAANFTAELNDQRWTRRAAASALGLTHTYVTSRANGTVEMSGSDLAMFARFLKIRVEDFFAEPLTAEDAVVTEMPKRGANVQGSDYSSAVLAPVTPIRFAG